MPNVVVRPFYQTIIDHIKRCARRPTRNEITNLFQLIRDTEITQDHKEIVEALRLAFPNPNWAWEFRLEATIKSVLAQEEAQMAEALLIEPSG